MLPDSPLPTYRATQICVGATDLWFKFLLDALDRALDQAGFEPREVADPLADLLDEFDLGADPFDDDWDPLAGVEADPLLHMDAQLTPEHGCWLWFEADQPVGVDIGRWLARTLDQTVLLFVANAAASADEDSEPTLDVQGWSVAVDGTLRPTDSDVDKGAIVADGGSDPVALARRLVTAALPVPLYEVARSERRAYAPRFVSEDPRINRMIANIKQAEAVELSQEGDRYVLRCLLPGGGKQLSFLKASEIEELRRGVPDLPAV